LAGKAQRHTGAARRLRRELTDVERKLWYRLRAKRFDGFKFRRQHPIVGYIVDFVCVEAKLIVELDGEQHAEVAALDYDAARTRELEKCGFRVIRFWNHEVNTDIEAVLNSIYAAVLGRA
jgi:very-short-patch-repair endonuclease